MLNKKALAGTAGAPKVYVEDVFSTYLYTGNGSSQTITNNIDLSGKGGMVWTKDRQQANNNVLQDTVRGVSSVISSNLSNGNLGYTNNITAFSSTGYSIGAGSEVNNSGGGGSTYASWTFRKAEKFFDVVTWTSQSGANTVSHNLGSAPGFIVMKATSATGNWWVYHRSLGNDYYMTLNQTSGQQNSPGIWSTSTTSFTYANGVVATGTQMVAYLFAHDAGGFGDAGSDSIIKCGSYTTDGSGNATVTLDWEPQWLLTKLSSTTGDWRIIDNMRQMSLTNNFFLYPNTSGAEVDNTVATWIPTATGFTHNAANANQTFIYIAIRRGPMKTPTTGTSVFSPITYAGNSTASRVISGLINAPDLVLYTARDAGAGLNSHITGSRLQGGGRYLLTEDASSEASSTAYGVQTYGQTSVTLGTATTSEQNASGVNYILYGMGRAPGFFDVVCYTGTGSARTVSHNLGVAPELMIIKQRSGTNGWPVYSSGTGNTQFAYLNQTSAFDTNSSAWNNTSPTSSVFTVGSGSLMNTNAATYVAYLFASLSGVSKIGTYTGNGSSVTVTTNFQPRFILVKRTDSTGDWIVSDSARGLVAGNDPYLELNTQDAEVTNEDWVDISSTSFTVNQTTNNANVNTGTYIYLAVS